MSKPQPIQISIPQPCHEDWNKMTPTEQGRFCNTCQKCVVDFTSYNDTMLYEYMQKNKNNKVCGRFNTTQLNRPIQIQHQPHSLLYKYFIALGLTLVLSQAPIENIRSAPFKTELLCSEFAADDTSKTKTDTVYIIDGVKCTSDRGKNIATGSVDQVEILLPGIPAKYEGSMPEYNLQQPATTERNNLFKRNKQN